jgi:hypothetical protein
VTRSSLGADPLDALLGGGDLGKRGHSLSHSTRPYCTEPDPADQNLCPTRPAQTLLDRPEQKMGSYQ